MAKPKPPMEDTPKGVKTTITLYVYPDGHANLTFEDGTNWPVDDEYQMIEWLAAGVLRPMQKQARRKAHGQTHP